MSKTQDKRTERAAQSKAFVRERRINQFAYFEANLNAGKQLLDSNKDKLSSEEFAALEKEYETNRETLEKLREEWHL